MANTKKLKVWGISKHPYRAVVATKTKKDAAAALGVSLHHFNGYAAETGNAQECEIALANPGKVFGRDFRYHHGPYVKINIKGMKCYEV